jgi:hypothetical protein
MKLYLVVEGPSDHAFLENVFSRRFDPGKLVFVVAGSKSNASSLARSLLARRHEPVALVLDADAVDDEVVGEQLSNYRTSLGLAGEPRLWTVVLFRPTLEAVFFHDPAIVETLFHRPLAPHEEELAEFAPRKVLERLLPEAGYTSREQLANTMDAKIADRLLNVPELAELAAFAARHLGSEAGVDSTPVAPDALG